MIVFGSNGLTDIEPQEIFTTHCDGCLKEISTASIPNGGIYENEDFHLWGPFALCKECDELQNNELKESINNDIFL